MHGIPDDPGVIPRSVDYVFNYVTSQPGRQFLLRVSYLELYQEKLTDLLDGTCQPAVREDKQRGIYVEGLHEEVVNNAGQVAKVMARGEKSRHVGSTNMNDRSSRSHTLFRMVIESSSGDDVVCVSTLNLVDLAGSERLASTGAEGTRAKEGILINKSLLALGSVISKLSEGKGGHVPYRDSMLTRILQPSLGGNSKTAVMCAVTPALHHAEETLSTLRFAARAKKVVNVAKVNEVMDDQALLKRYQKEIEELRKQLESNTSGSLGGDGDGGPVSNDPAVLEELEKKEEENAEMREKLAKLEGKMTVSSLSKWVAMMGFAQRLHPDEKRKIYEDKAREMAKRWMSNAHKSRLNRILETSNQKVASLSETLETAKSEKAELDDMVGKLREELEAYRA